MTNRSRTAGVQIAVSVMACIATACATRAPAGADEHFQYRVEEYLETRRQVTEHASSLEVARSAEDLNALEDYLAARLALMRRGFGQGLFFSPPVANQVRRVIAERLSESDGGSLAAAVTEVSPGRYIPMVNERYPSNLPRATMPPGLLQVLPPLPQELEYRFAGSTLLLLDRNTGLVLDVLGDAFPSSADEARAGTAGAG